MALPIIHRLRVSSVHTDHVHRAGTSVAFHVGGYAQSGIFPCRKFWCLIFLYRQCLNDLRTIQGKAQLRGNLIRHMVLGVRYSALEAPFAAPRTICQISAQLDRDVWRFPRQLTNMLALASSIATPLYV